ncbi:MAG: hypothetical protein AAB497_03920 [Patescibacteria group bacterium]
MFEDAPKGKGEKDTSFFKEDKNTGEKEYNINESGIVLTAQEKKERGDEWESPFKKFQEEER